jgi:hypothetical protein
LTFFGFLAFVAFCFLKRCLRVFFVGLGESVGAPAAGSADVEEVVVVVEASVDCAWHGDNETIATEARDNHTMALSDFIKAPLLLLVLLVLLVLWGFLRLCAVSIPIQLLGLLLAGRAINWQGIVGFALGSLGNCHCLGQPSNSIQTICFTQ